MNKEHERKVERGPFKASVPVPFHVTPHYNNPVTQSGGSMSSSAGGVEAVFLLFQIFVIEIFQRAKISLSLGDGFPLPNEQAQ